MTKPGEKGKFTLNKQTLQSMLNLGEHGGNLLNSKKRNAEEKHGNKAAHRAAPGGTAKK